VVCLLRWREAMKLAENASSLLSESKYVVWSCAVQPVFSRPPSAIFNSASTV
jgi:hypothetical protein